MDKFHRRRPAATLRAFALLLTAAIGGASAATFDVAVSPPTFELKAKRGAKVREAFRITNNDSQAGAYLFRTADWDLGSTGTVTFAEGQPVAGSCRPWVRIERHALNLGPRATRPYRFEVHVPEDAPDGECRFALIVSPDPRTINPVISGNLRIPVVGRIGVIAYVAIGDARPKLSFRGLKQGVVNGRPAPVAVFSNDGTAHGRPSGILDARDATGRSIEAQVMPAPVLPGQTREVPIIAAEKGPDGNPLALNLPLRLKGKIEWEGGSRAIDEQVQ
jgi:hypothetical protein